MCFRGSSHGLTELDTLCAFSLRHCATYCHANCNVERKSTNIPRPIILNCQGIPIIFFSNWIELNIRYYSHGDFLWLGSPSPPVLVLEKKKTPVQVLHQTWKQGRQVNPHLYMWLRFQLPQVVVVFSGSLFVLSPYFSLCFFPLFSPACSLSGWIWIDFGRQRLQCTAVQSPTLWKTKIWRD